MILDGCQEARFIQHQNTRKIHDTEVGSWEPSDEKQEEKSWAQWMHLNGIWENKRAKSTQKKYQQKNMNRAGEKERSSKNKTSSLHTSHHEAKIPFILGQKRAVNQCLTVFISNKFVNHFCAFHLFLLPQKNSRFSLSLTHSSIALWMIFLSSVKVLLWSSICIIFWCFNSIQSLFECVCVWVLENNMSYVRIPIETFYVVPYYSVKWNFSRSCVYGREERKKDLRKRKLRLYSWAHKVDFNNFSKPRNKKQKIRLRFENKVELGMLQKLRH